MFWISKSKIFWRLLSFLYLLFFSVIIVTGDAVVGLIKAAEYPVEVHYVQTPDGFKLRLHRIPHGVRKLNYDVSIDSGENNENLHQNESLVTPVFLMHGLVSSASTWVTRGPDKSLGFMLADAGYDVWMLNARATSYSAAHKTLDPQSKNYWDYSWHEIGNYDIPTAINYVLENTKYSKLKYVGHSQGCTVFAVALSMHPNLNSKVESAYLMTPAILLHHMSSIVKNIIANEKELQEVASFLKIYGIQIKSPLSRRLSDMFCKDKQSTNIICSDMLFRIIGGDSGQLDKATFIPMMTKYVVDNISMKQLAHFAQLVRNAKFAMFDYGDVENRKRYKGSTSPEYNISKIEVPITVIYGSKDALVSSTDVELLVTKLPNVRQTLKLPWNHLDFIFGKDVDVRINDFIIRSMKNDSSVN